MLDVAIEFLKDELNTYLLARTGSDAVEVTLSPVVDESGKYAFDDGRICATVINIEEEAIFKAQTPEYIYQNGQHIVLPPPLKLNVSLMFAANFKLYDQGLKFISYLLSYFQAHPVFAPDAFPALDARIEKLSIELQSLNYEQLNQVWAFIGGKQLPSVIYKLRMVILQADIQTAIQKPILEIQTTLQDK